VLPRLGLLNPPAPPDTPPLSLHDALPISATRRKPATACRKPSCAPGPAGTPSTSTSSRRPGSARPPTASPSAAGGACCAAAAHLTERSPPPPSPPRSTRPVWHSSPPCGSFPTPSARPSCGTTSPTSRSQPSPPRPAWPKEPSTPGCHEGGPPSPCCCPTPSWKGLTVRDPIDLLTNLEALEHEPLPAAELRRRGDQRRRRRTAGVGVAAALLLAAAVTVPNLLADPVVPAGTPT